MNTDKLFEDVIGAYEGFYNIVNGDEVAPFDARGFMSNEAKQYFLVKAAKIASVNSYEYVYFKKCQCITAGELKKLDAAAWEDGLKRVKPDADHKNTDVALIIVADEVSGDVKQDINAYRHSASYLLGLHGFSNYRLVVIETSTGDVLTNRRGRDLKDFVQQIISRSGNDQL
ncbi:MAG: hypothetical protein K6F34_01705 [Lachnospiraceae bacterium]|nr:hypothetical protein [Lachnospiraceae bacterium]